MGLERRSIRTRYLSLRNAERSRFLLAKNDLVWDHRAAMNQLKYDEQDELRPWPSEAVNGKHVEILEEKTCPNCGGALLSATIENAKKVAEKRERQNDWPSALAGMRKKKFCCYYCTPSSRPHKRNSVRGEECHSVYCTLKSLYDDLT